MRLNELIKTNNWLSVSMTFTSLYPDQNESHEAYKKVYDTLQQMTPVESEIEIILQQRYDNATNEKSYVDVSGSKKIIQILS